VTDTSTAQDLLNFYQTGLNIDTTPSTNPAIPTPGATLIADPANAGSAQFAITGNEGTANALEIPVGGFANQTSATPLTFADGTNAAGVKSDPSGESVNTSFTAYDSLGNPINVNVTAVLESTATTGNTWRFMATSPNSEVGGPVVGDGTLTYNSAGQLVASTGTTVNIDRTGTGAETPMSFTLDFSGTSQLGGSTSTLVMSNQDGMPPGTLSSYSIGTDGTITGAYSNGMTRSLGQIAVASFTNPQGLNNIGGNIYGTGADSGAAVITSPQSQGTGSLRSGSLELSNVDLSTEFTNLITASTGFSASSHVITTGDQLIEQLLNSSH
jgi:flagellar hook protein FlgE